MNENENREEIELANNATIAGLLKHAFLPVITMILASLYIVVDGIFIANLTPEYEYAGSIIAAPYITCFSTIGFMIGGGGNAYVSKLLGEGKKKRAVDVFSMLIEAAFVLTIVVSVFGFLFYKVFLRSQGASGQLMERAYEYGAILFMGTVFLALQYAFQLFMIMSGNETRAFIYTLIAGVVNLGFDALFMIVFHMGVIGAAIGTVLGEFVGALLPFIFFIRCKKKESILYFKWIKPEFLPIRDVCYNGLSEMISTIAESVMGFFFNAQLLKTVGELGVDAYGSIMYMFLIFNLSFVGFNEAVVPLMAYQYGAGNYKGLNALIKKCMTIITGLSVLFFAISELLAGPLADIFTKQGSEAYTMLIEGFRLCGIALLFMGIAMLIPSIYTALGDGFVSGVLTLFEVLVFPAVLVMILPRLWGIKGVWRSQYVAWIISFVMCVIVIKVIKKVPKGESV